MIVVVVVVVCVCVCVCFGGGGGGGGGDLPTNISRWIPTRIEAHMDVFALAPSLTLPVVTMYMYCVFSRYST